MIHVKLDYNYADKSTTIYLVNDFTNKKLNIDADALWDLLQQDITDTVLAQERAIESLELTIVKLEQDANKYNTLKKCIKEFLAE